MGVLDIMDRRRPTEKPQEVHVNHDEVEQEGNNECGKSNCCLDIPGTSTIESFIPLSTLLEQRTYSLNEFTHSAK